MTVACHSVDLVLPGPKSPRSPGVHLSGVIQAIAMETGILKPDWEEEVTTLEEMDSTLWWASLPPDAKARICMGLAWEEFYIASQLPGVTDHPGEMLVDGIFMTPDGEELVKVTKWQLRGVEVKCTFKSMNTVMTKPWGNWDGKVYDSYEHGPLGPLSNQWMWVTQCAGYARAMGTTLMDLHVLFVAGDYRMPLRPTAYKFEIEFTPDELDYRWSQLVDYKDYVMRSSL